MAPLLTQPATPSTPTNPSLVWPDMPSVAWREGGNPRFPLRRMWDRGQQVDVPADHLDQLLRDDRVAFVAQVRDVWRPVPGSRHSTANDVAGIAASMRPNRGCTRGYTGLHAQEAAIRANR